MLAIEEDIKSLRYEISRLEGTRDKRKAEYEVQVRKIHGWKKVVAGKEGTSKMLFRDGGAIGFVAAESKTKFLYILLSVPFS